MSARSVNNNEVMKQSLGEGAHAEFDGQYLTIFNGGHSVYLRNEQLPELVRFWAKTVWAKTYRPENAPENSEQANNKMY